MLQGLQIREKEKKKRKNNMKKLLVLFAIVAIAMTGLFATDLTITLSPSDVQDTFTVKIVEGEYDSYPSSYTETSAISEKINTTTDLAMKFTILWDMTTNKTSPLAKVTVKTTTLATSASDTIKMTASAKSFDSNSKAPNQKGPTPTVTVGGTDADEIVSFAADSVKVVKSQGGVAITMGVAASDMSEATAGATYTSTVTVTATTN